MASLQHGCEELSGHPAYSNILQCGLPGKRPSSLQNAKSEIKASA